MIDANEYLQNCVECVYVCVCERERKRELFISFPIIHQNDHSPYRKEFIIIHSSFWIAVILTHTAPTLLF